MSNQQYLDAILLLKLQSAALKVKQAALTAAQDEVNALWQGGNTALRGPELVELNDLIKKADDRSHEVSFATLLRDRCVLHVQRCWALRRFF